MNGWIKIHRKMRQWQHYKNIYVRIVFEDLLLSATAKPYTFDGIKVSAGDAVTSVATIQRNTGISKPIVIKALKALKESGEISHRLIGRISIYHVNKFCFYQLESGKRDLPHEDTSGKQDLPVLVNEVNQSGKRDLPHNKNNKNNNKNIVVADAHARTHEDFIADALNDLRVEQGCMAMRISPEEYRQLVNEVINDWTYRQLPDNEWTLTHLLAQMRIKHNINNRNNGNNQYSGQPGDTRAKLDADAVKAMAALAAESRHPAQPTW